MKNDIVWNEQLAAEMVVLNLQPKPAHKSDIKAATMKTCVAITGLKVSSLNIIDNLLCM